MQRKLAPCFDDPVAHGLTASHHGARALASYHIRATTVCQYRGS